jgi:hypothetical protein
MKNLSKMFSGALLALSPYAQSQGLDISVQAKGQGVYTIELQPTIADSIVYQPIHTEYALYQKFVQSLKGLSYTVEPREDFSGLTLELRKSSGTSQVYDDDHALAGFFQQYGQVLDTIKEKLRSGAWQDRDFQDDIALDLPALKIAEGGGLPSVETLTLLGGRLAYCSTPVLTTITMPSTLAAFASGPNCSDTSILKALEEKLPQVELSLTEGTLREELTKNDGQNREIYVSVSRLVDNLCYVPSPSAYPTILKVYQEAAWVGSDFEDDLGLDFRGQCRVFALTEVLPKLFSAYKDQIGKSPLSKSNPLVDDILTRMTRNQATGPGQEARDLNEVASLIASTLVGPLARDLRLFDTFSDVNPTVVGPVVSTYQGSWTSVESIFSEIYTPKPGRPKTPFQTAFDKSLNQKALLQQLVALGTWSCPKDQALSLACIQKSFRSFSKYSISLQIGDGEPRVFETFGGLKQ